MTSRDSRRHVALIYDAQHPYDINVMSGVAAYLQRSGSRWNVYLEQKALNDKAAHRVLEACRASGIRVPEEIPVVGVDNDEMLCQLSSPPLSSVEQGGRRVGFRAAELLDRLMSGRRPAPRKYVIPPEGIVVRRSSDVMAVADEGIAAALAFIQERAGDGIKVQDVARAMPLSRSQLDRRFRCVVGRTIHAEIRRVRMNQARRFLLDTSLPLKQIARRCGFRTVQHLTEVFGEVVGVAPGKFRSQHLL